MFEPFLTRFQALIAIGVQTSRASEMTALSVSTRVAAENVRRAQAALARAKAEQQQDRNRADKLDRSIQDLERRARSALQKGQEALARETAEAIAVLEEERDSLRDAVADFDRDLADLTEQFHRAQSRLRALKRGERTVAVRETVQKAKAIAAPSGPSALNDAEERLNTILDAQERDALTERAFVSLSPEQTSDALVEKLADAGCGDPVRKRADDVYERLKTGTPLLLEKATEERT